MILHVDILLTCMAFQCYGRIFKISPVCLKLNFIVKVHQCAVWNCVVNIMLCIVFRLLHAATCCHAIKFSLPTYHASVWDTMLM